MLRPDRLSGLRLLPGLFVFALLLPAGAPDASAQGSPDRLVQGLKDPSFKVRLQAAILIGKRKLVRAAPALRDALDDDHDAVRAAAAVSLGKMGDQDARGRVVRLLGHDSDLVARAAEKSLVLLDKARGPAAKYLLAIDKPRAPKGVNRSHLDRLAKVMRAKLEQNPQVIFSAGEEQVLKGTRLNSHLSKRKLTGILVQPKLSRLQAKEKHGTTVVDGKVSVMLVTLVKKRMEFSAGGEADAGKSWKPR
jgi:HEAT repeat protein